MGYSSDSIAVSRDMDSFPEMRKGTHLDSSGGMFGSNKGVLNGSLLAAKGQFMCFSCPLLSFRGQRCLIVERCYW